MLVFFAHRAILSLAKTSRSSPTAASASEMFLLKPQPHARAAMPRPTRALLAAACASLSVAAAIAAPTNVALGAAVTHAFSGAASALTSSPDAPPSLGWASTTFTAYADHTLFPDTVTIDLGAHYPLEALTLSPPPPSPPGGGGGSSFPTTFTLTAGALGEPGAVVLSVVDGTPPTTGPLVPVTYPFPSPPSAPPCARFVTLSVTATNGTAAPGPPIVEGGRFLQGNADPAIFWVASAPGGGGGGGDGPVKNHVFGTCTPCAGLNVCLNFTVVAQAYIDAIAAGENFTCSQLPSGPPTLTFPVQLGRLGILGGPSTCTPAIPPWPPTPPPPPPPPVAAPAPVGLTVEGRRADDAAAVNTAAPTFNWTLPANGGWARGTAPAAARVQVNATAGGSGGGSVVVWDSGLVAAPGELGMRYGGQQPLAAGGAYTWRVQLTLTVPPSAPGNQTTLVETAWSDPFPFGVGLLAPADWAGAEWVGTGQPATHAGVYLRSEVSLPPGRGGGDVARATAYVCGLGYADTYVDGVRLGGTLALSPGWTQYNVETSYVALDATAQMQANATKGAAHAVGVVLGDGWYAISADPWVHHLERAVYVSTPKLLLRLVVEWTDGGAPFDFVTNSSSAPSPSAGGWWWANGSITRAWIGAEDIDARAALPAGWAAPGGGALGGTWVPVAAVDPPAGALVAQREAPTRVQEAVAPVAVRAVTGAVAGASAGVFVFDFGREVQGWLEVTATAAAPNTTLSILPCGSMYGLCDETTVPNNMGGPDLAQWTLAGGGAAETYAPRFMYAAVRTAVVRVVSGALAAPLGLDSVTAVHVGFDLTPPPPQQQQQGDGGNAAPSSSSFSPPSSSFASSDTLLDWLMASLDRTMQAYGTGCPNDPTREKKCWVQDMETTMLPMIASFGGPAALTFDRWLRDLAANCNATTGACPEVAPGPVFDAYNGAHWGGMAVWAAWQLHWATGDVGVLSRAYPSAAAYVRFLNASAGPGYDVAWGLGDWVSTVPACANNASWINTPALFLYARLVASMARTLAVPGDDAAEFAALAEAVRSAYNARFLAPGGSGVYAAGEQCTQALALGYALPPDAATAAAAGAALVARVVADGGVTSGFVTLTHWVRAMASLAPAAGHAALLAQAPAAGGGVAPLSSVYTLSAGSDHDLLKEQWDGSGAEMPALGVPIAAWARGAVCGVRPHAADDATAWLAGVPGASPPPVPLAPGWAAFVVAPAGPLVPALQWANCTVDTPRGTVVAAWRRTPQGLLLTQVGVPVGSSATVVLPTSQPATVTESGVPVGDGVPGVTPVPALGDGTHAAFVVSSGVYYFAAADVGGVGAPEK
jgi:alpha-L-rhamnosidase